MGISFGESQNADPEQGAIASAIIERINRLANSTQNGFTQVVSSMEEIKNICDQQRNELKDNIIAWIDNVGGKVDKNTKQINAIESQQVDINVAILNHHKEKEKLANSIFIAGAESKEKALLMLKTITYSEDIQKDPQVEIKHLSKNDPRKRNNQGPAPMIMDEYKKRREHSSSRR